MNAWIGVLNGTKSPRPGKGEWSACRLVQRKVGGSPEYPPLHARFGCEAARAAQWHFDTRPGGPKVYHAAMSGMEANKEAALASASS